MRGIFKIFATSVLLAFLLATVIYAQKYVKINSSSDLYSTFLAKEKTVYKKVNTYTSSSIQYVDFETLDGKTKFTERSANMPSMNTNAVFLSAEIDGISYVEILNGKDDYVLEIDKSSGTAVLNTLGKIKFRDTNISGGLENELDESVVGKSRVRKYYVHNGVLVYMTPHVSVQQYDFAILKYVEKSGSSYIANIYIDGETKKYPLNTSCAVETDSATFTAEQLYDFHKLTTDTDGKPIYNCLVVCGIEKATNGYTLSASKNLDRGAYKILSSGVKINYNYATGLCSAGGLSKIVINNKSKVYYKYLDDTSSSTPIKLGVYSYAEMPHDKNYTITTSGETYLYYDADMRVYYLLATMIPDGIPGATAPDGTIVSGEDSLPYANDGSKITYAYKSSVKKASSGIIYNSNYFMNMKTAINMSATLDKRREYHSVYNKGTDGGYFYAKNDSSLSYDKITRSVADSLDIMDLGEAVEILKSGSNTFYIMTVNDTDELCKLTTDAVIWGLSVKGSTGSYKKLTVAELEAMMALVEECNSKKGTNVKINSLAIYNDGEGKEAIALVVELFEKDSNGFAVSVNDTIFRNLGVAPDVTPTDKVFVSCDKREYYNTDSVKATWNTLANATGYSLNVTNKSGETVYIQKISGNSTANHSFSLGVGTYFVTVEAEGVANSLSNAFEIKVKQKNFTVTYHTNGGSEAPPAQTKNAGSSIRLTTVTPVKDGYTFIGWSPSLTSCSALYSSGAYYYDDKDLTLFAVWIKDPEFAGVSLVLDSFIGVRLYVDICSDVGNNDRIYRNQNEYSASLKYDSEKDLYYSEFSFFANDVDNGSHTFTLKFNNTVFPLSTFSLKGLIAEYKELAKTDPKYAKCLDLVNALETYSIHADAFIDKGRSDDFRVNMGDVTAPVKSGSAAIKHISTSLRVFDTVDIRHYFLVEDNKSHIYECNSKTVRVTRLSDGIVAVDICDISAHEFGTTYTLTVDGTLNISYSVLNYAKAMADDTRVGSLVNAMYNYWYYAKEYVNK